MVFVTGGTGLVGAHLIYQLIKQGEQVKALKRETSHLTLIRNVFRHYGEDGVKLLDKIIWVDGDILDLYFLMDELSSVNYVYHCAAYVSFDPRQSKSMIEINEVGTANMVEAALYNKVKKFCHVSSIAALGVSVNDQPVDEDAIWQPEKMHTPYSISKFRSEMEVWRASKEGLDVVIVNPSVIIGVGEENNGSSRLFQMVKKGQRYYTKGVNGYVDVKDVIKSMIALMKSDVVNERFVLNGANLSYQELFNTIAVALGIQPPSKYATPFLTGLAWRIEKFRCFFSRKVPGLTKSTANSSHKKSFYNGAKIQRALQLNYTSISDSINEVTQFLNK